MILVPKKYSSWPCSSHNSAPQGGRRRGGRGLKGREGGEGEGGGRRGGRGEKVGGGGVIGRKSVLYESIAHRAELRMSRYVPNGTMFDLFRNFSLAFFR